MVCGAVSSWRATSGNVGSDGLKARGVLTPMSTLRENAGCGSFEGSAVVLAVSARAHSSGHMHVCIAAAGSKAWEEAACFGGCGARRLETCNKMDAPPPLCSRSSPSWRASG